MTQQPKTDWPDWLTALKRSKKGAPRQQLGIQAGAYLEGHVDGWNSCIDHLAQRGLIVPDGWVAVPREPDDEYVEAVCFKARVCGGIFESVHSAMLAAAPKMEGKE